MLYGPEYCVPPGHEVVLGVSSNGSHSRDASLRVLRSCEGIESVLHEFFLNGSRNNYRKIVLPAVHSQSVLRLEAHTERWMCRNGPEDEESGCVVVCWEDDMNSDPDYWNIVVEVIWAKPKVVGPEVLHVSGR